jgi:hypothetical protein
MYQSLNFENFSKTGISLVLYVYFETLGIAD